MKDKIELLDTDLLEDKENLKFVQYWHNICGVEIGWSYWLDLIWILQNIKKAGLKKGDTILDAGGGIGLMQFLLAAKGYNIISIDFSNRKKPLLPSFIFEIEKIGNDTFQDAYVKHLDKTWKKNTLQKVKKLVSKTIKSLTSGFFNELNKKSSFGKVSFYQSDMRDMNAIKSHSIDAVISVSAVEHLPNPQDIKIAVSEMKRVLKKDAPIFITTSATDRPSWWHEGAKGWSFDEKDLIDIFGVNNTNFKEFDRYFKKIEEDKFMPENLPTSYYKRAECGLPYGIWNPTYIPVGITKINH